MKKKIAAILTVAMLIPALAACGSKNETAEDAKTNDTAKEDEAKDFDGAQLVVCTWGGSTGAATKELAADFEAKYNCEIIIDEVNANSDRLTKLQSQVDSGNVEADVVYLSGPFAKQGEGLDIFEKIDTSIVDNMDELYDFAQNDTGYGPMVCVGRFGIMYNADMLEEKGLEAPTSYMDLFDDKYAGLVSLPAMTATAGPYVLSAIAEELGGSLEDTSAAMELYDEKKDNIKLWYTSDIVPALTQKEVAITVYMDLMLPVLEASGLNMVWVDAAEGNFADDVYINVVKDAPNAELAQLFVKYTLEVAQQEKFIALNSEAPTNMNATMDEEHDAYMVFGQDEFDNCTFFDYDTLNELKPTLIEEWQKLVG